MSMGRELLAELFIDAEIERMELEQEYIRIQAFYESGYWITKDKTTIKISDMESSHIHNSIRMLERNIESDLYSDMEVDLAEIAISEFKRELKRRYPPADPAFAWG